MKKRLIIIIGSIVAILLIWVGVDYFILSKPSPTESSPTEQPASSIEIKPPPEQLAPPEESKPSTEQPPLTFEQKIENLRKAIADVSATGESKAITLVFTEAEANDQAAKLLARVEMPEDIPLEIKTVHIDFQTGNNVLIEVETGILGIKVKVTSHVGIEEGKPAVEVTDVDFGALPLPESLKDEIAVIAGQTTGDLLDQLIEAESGSDGKVDLEYTDIDIQEEAMTIAVIIKPRA